MLLLCTVACKESVIETGVKEIYVENLKDHQIYKITTKGNIDKIVYKINSSKKEFCVFIPNTKMALIYENKKKKVILINGNKFKINGISYVSNYDLQNIK